ncbi:MAG: outer membrane homotrimeric porin [Desulfovibrionaceae bacterium]|nr:outer membrane homotrimeric porin [Desulfovibrionaceae bacterium]
MKRLTLLAAALVMVLGMAVSASAAPEVTVSGNILINAVWKSNWDFDDGNNAAGADDDAFQIRERIDLAFTAVANENLKAVIVFRSVRDALGQGDLSTGAGGARGAGGGNVTLGLNQGYIDFNWPGTSVNVKAGFMPVALPSAVGGGSMIQDDNASGVLVSAPITDNVSLLGGWIRFFDTADAAGNDIDDSQIDAWVVAVPLTFEGFNMTPFVVYAPLGENADQTVIAFNGVGGARTDYGLGLLSGNVGKAASTKLDDAWWAGSSFELSMLDPFILKGDINYGIVNGDSDDMDREGWLFDLALEYTGFDFMNLEAAFAYSTGYDNDEDNDGRMPVLADDWALGTFWFGNGLITGDDLGHANNNMGFWALALSATGIQSFAEGLTHDIHVVYAQGTNEDRNDSTGAAVGNLVYGNSLLEDDSMLELDFNTFYKIYDELTLYNGIGYINLDADDDANGWAAGNDGGDAWKFQLGLKYVF